jgi:N-acetyl-gamma-glutamyl-phosphate reductase
MMNKLSAAVLGATGYTGQELVRILSRHPRIETHFATSESGAGTAVRGTDLHYVKAADVPFGEVDIVVACLPHGESGAYSIAAHEAGVKVVDLSADLRAGEAGAEYGVPELWRDCVRGKTLVANPGCYPTGILLGLAPLIRAGLIDATKPTMVDAASGVTGAGRTAKRDLLYGEVAEDYRAYAVGNAHRHVPEIGAGLGRIAGGVAPQFVFTPHLLPVRRGILETMYVPLVAGADAGDAIEATRAMYGDEPFVEAMGDGLPSLRDVVHTNRVAIGHARVTGVSDPLVLCVVALDNLVKGAAGQAVQNANLMLGLEETAGLLP